MRKIWVYKLKYFINPWNLMNLVPPTLILINLYDLYGLENRETKVETPEAKEA